MRRRAADLCQAATLRRLRWCPSGTQQSAQWLCDRALLSTCGVLSRQCRQSGRNHRLPACRGRSGSQLGEATASCRTARLLAPSCRRHRPDCESSTFRCRDQLFTIAVRRPGGAPTDRPEGRTAMSRVFVLLIRCYQRFISPLSGPRCRYYPTCSAYALTAIQRHGVLRGTALASWRLLRCNPWSRGGVDLVPSSRQSSQAAVEGSARSQQGG